MKLKHVCSMLWAPFTFELLTFISSLFSCCTSAFGGLLAWIPPVYVQWQEPGSCYTELVHPSCLSSSPPAAWNPLHRVLVPSDRVQVSWKLRGSSEGKCWQSWCRGKRNHYSLHSGKLVGLKRRESGTGKDLVQRFTEWVWLPLPDFGVSLRHFWVMI